MLDGMGIKRWDRKKILFLLQIWRLKKQLPSLKQPVETPVTMGWLED